MKFTLSRDGISRVSVRVTFRLSRWDVAAHYLRYTGEYELVHAVEIARRHTEKEVLDKVRADLEANGEETVSYYIGDNSYEPIVEALLDVFAERFNW